MNGISMGLQVPKPTAERMKTFYGGVVATGMDDREMIEIGGETGDWEHDRRNVSRAEVIGIMRPRVEEILEEVRDRLDAAGFFYPDHKAASMKTNLRNLWSRMPLTRSYAQTLHGMLRQMVRWANRR